MPSSLTQLILDDRFRKIRYFSALALFTLIVIIGSVPGARQEIATVASGLVLHSIAYSILTILLFTGGTGGRSARAFKALLTALLMGAIDESVQSMLSYRRGSAQDWMVDAVSALVTVTLLWTFLPSSAENRPA